jgi:hypothetical protein
VGGATSGTAAAGGGAAGGGGGGSGGTGAAASAGASTGAGRTAGGPGARPVTTSKKAIRNKGPRAKRTSTVIKFSLGRAAIVRFSIRREAPNCVVVGSFAVRGHRGENRVRFFGRYRGTPLPPGTYTLTATTRRGDRRVLIGRVTVVIVGRGADLADARAQPTTCASSAGGRDSDASSSFFAGDEGQGLPAEEQGVAGASSDTSGGKASAAGSAFGGGGVADESARDGRILGLRNPFEDAPAWLRPLLLAALAIAIILLLLAALPASRVRPSGASELVLHRRTELAVGGATVAAAVALLAFLL